MWRAPCLSTAAGGSIVRRRQKSSVSTPAPLTRLGIATPLPFLGRVRDLEALTEIYEAVLDGYFTLPR